MIVDNPVNNFNGLFFISKTESLANRPPNSDLRRSLIKVYLQSFPSSVKKPALLLIYYTNQLSCIRICLHPLVRL